MMVVELAVIVALVLVGNVVLHLSMPMPVDGEWEGDDE